uniref:Uncharacterized protein n=1 Tax=Panstrongylus lignarius TaxID=156445 RepID=A0A224XQS1_9HEMI
MSDLKNILNTIGEEETQYLSLRQLSLNTPYPIISINKVDTKYGKSLYVILKANSHNLKCFLPKIYGHKIDEHIIDKYKPMSLSLINKGVNKNNSFKIEFV